jgi:uncharacterized coiled-coil DUF342 family protein
MSTVAKVFVVLNLVFALIYAGVAATLLQKQEHWKYECKMKEMELAKVQNDLTQKINELREKNDTLAKSVDEWRGRLDQTKTSLTTQQNENKELRKDFEELKGKYDGLVEQYRHLAQDLEGVKRQKDELQQKLIEAESERNDAIHLRDQSVDDLQRLQKDIEDMKVDVSNHKRRIVELAKQKSELEWILTRVQEKVGAEILKDVFSAPKIDGAVIGVSNRVNLVVINVGEEDGVRVGYEFTIYRGTSYVAKMVVEKVYPSQAAGRVLIEMQKDKVQQGDRVSTQIY